MSQLRVLNLEGIILSRDDLGDSAFDKKPAKFLLMLLEKVGGLFTVGIQCSAYSVSYLA